MVNRTSKKTGHITGHSDDDSLILTGGPTVLFRVNRDRGVSIIRTDDDQSFYTLDGIAAELFLMIDGKKSLAAIKARLSKKHRPPKERFDRDVRALVKQLLETKLLRKAGE